MHLGTTSKIHTPTLGVGWMVAAPEVVTVILAYRDRTGSGPAPAGQLVATEFARNGDLRRHLRRLRRSWSTHLCAVGSRCSATRRARTSWSTLE
ncbi:hypothetical protein ABT009_46330 [Streptomyces sp. NPDC002896]|uniref:hypothetical protein n=1 Tax=Streptomyces sp. NPDC002896 TaxID=3154438 RepID=UPI00332A33A9